MSAQTVLSGYIMFVLATMICARCPNLDTCLSSYGSKYPDPEKFIGFICQNKDQFKDCHSEFRICYSPFMFFFPKDGVDARLKSACSKQHVFSEAVKCSNDFGQKLAKNGLTSACDQHSPADHNKTQCTMLERWAECSSFKPFVVCIAKPMILMSRDGIDVECLNVYISLSSGPGLRPFSAITPLGCLIAFSIIFI